MQPKYNNHKRGRKFEEEFRVSPCLVCLGSHMTNNQPKKPTDRSFEALVFQHERHAPGCECPAR